MFPPRTCSESFERFIYYHTFVHTYCCHRIHGVTSEEPHRSSVKITNPTDTEDIRSEAFRNDGENAEDVVSSVRNCQQNKQHPHGIVQLFMFLYDVDEKRSTTHRCKG